MQIKVNTKALSALATFLFFIYTSQLYASPQLNLKCLLQGLYNHSDLDNSRPATGDYAIHIELRDNPEGTHSNYRYYHITLDKYGNSGNIVLNNITDGDYYIAVWQLNHLAAKTLNTVTVSQDSTTIVNFSDPASPNYVQAYGIEPLYPEQDEKLSLRSGNADGNKFVNVSDFIIWRRANGSVPDAGNWDVRADLDANEMINVSDFLFWRLNNGFTAYATISPLDIKITSPQDGSTTNQTSITVSGTVNDNNATVQVNGVDALVQNGTFTAENISLEVGNNLITATTKDAIETQVSNSITVTRYNEKPIIESMTPEDKSTFIEEDTVTVSIVASDPEGGPLEHRFLIDGEVKQDWSRNNIYQTVTEIGDKGEHIVTGKVRDDCLEEDLKGISVYIFRKTPRPF